MFSCAILQVVSIDIIMLANMAAAAAAAAWGGRRLCGKMPE